MAYNNTLQQSGLQNEPTNTLDKVKGIIDTGKTFGTIAFGSILTYAALQVGNSGNSSDNKLADLNTYNPNSNSLTTITDDPELQRSISTFVDDCEGTVLMEGITIDGDIEPYAVICQNIDTFLDSTSGKSKLESESTKGLTPTQIQAVNQLVQALADPDAKPVTELVNDSIQIPVFTLDGQPVDFKGDSDKKLELQSMQQFVSNILANFQSKGFCSFQNPVLTENSKKCYEFKTEIKDSNGSTFDLIVSVNLPNPEVASEFEALTHPNDADLSGKIDPLLLQSIQNSFKNQASTVDNSYVINFYYQDDNIPKYQAIGGTEITGRTRIADIVVIPHESYISQPIGNESNNNPLHVAISLLIGTALAAGAQLIFSKNRHNPSMSNDATNINISETPQLFEKDLTQRTSNLERELPKEYPITIWFENNGAYDFGTSTLILDPTASVKKSVRTILEPLNIDLETKERAIHSSKEIVQIINTIENTSDNLQQLWELANRNTRIINYEKIGEQILVDYKLMNDDNTQINTLRLNFNKETSEVEMEILPVSGKNTEEETQEDFSQIKNQVLVNKPIPNLEATFGDMSDRVLSIMHRSLSPTEELSSQDREFLRFSANYSQIMNLVQSNRSILKNVNFDGIEKEDQEKIAPIVIKKIYDYLLGIKPTDRDRFEAFTYAARKNLGEGIKPTSALKDHVTHRFRIQLVANSNGGVVATVSSNNHNQAA